MKKNNLISIAIPIHKTKMGQEYLYELLDSIQNQTYKEFEVIISDSSEDQYAGNVISKFNKKLKIKHIRSDFKTLPTNANNALNNCSGEIIKPMFSDDIFLEKDSLEHVNYLFNHNECNWILFSSYDFKYKKNNKIIPLNGRVPEWNEKLLFGNNTIGAPSVMAYRNIINENFDKNLRYLIDCDFYYILKRKYGDPYFSNKYLIGARHHEEQETELIGQMDILKEKFYLSYKHKIKNLFYKI